MVTPHTRPADLPPFIATRITPSFLLAHTHAGAGPRRCLVLALLALTWAVMPGADIAASTAVPGATITTAVTWSAAGSPYIVQGGLAIASGGSLTIGAGVQVRLVAGTWIEVQDGGTLTATGAAGQVIGFTSDAASPQGGDWYYIDAKAGSHLRLTYCDLGYGGRNSNPALFLRTSDAQVRNCTLHHFAGTGINLEGGGNTSLVADTTITTTTGWAVYQNTINMAPQYSNLTLGGGGTNALIIDGDTVAGSVTLDGSAARLKGAPIILTRVTIVPAAATLTVAPGTDLRTPPGGQFEVREGGVLIAEGTASAPILFRANSATAAPGDWYYIIAQAGSRLRLKYCDLGYGGRNNNPALVLRGSDAQIRNCTLHHFPATGINLEGAGITPLIADTTVTTTTGWAVYQNTMNMAPQYSHVTLVGGGVNAVIVDGDTVSGSVTLDGTAARFTGGVPIILTRVTIVPAAATLTVAPGTELRTPAGGAFEVREGGTMIAEGTTSAPILFRANTATPTPGDWYHILAQAGSRLRLKYCDLGYGGRNNNPALVLRGSDAQIRNCTLHHFPATGINLEGAGITPLIADTTVTTTTGWAVYQNTMNMAPQYSHVTLAGAGVNALVVDGDVVSGAVTLSGNAAKFTGRKPILLVRNTIVPAGAALTVEAGTELRTPAGGAFEIRDGGTMIAEGTASAQITFRANTATAAPGDWYYIDARAGSHLRLKYCDLGYGGRNGTPALLLRTSDAQVSNSVVHHSLGTGVQIEGAGVGPTLTDTRIESNAGWAVYQNTLNMAPLYRGVSLSGNGHDVLLIDGDQVPGAVTLAAAGIGGKPIQFVRNILVLSGASLTIDAGTPITFGVGWALEVRNGGTLVAAGTPAARISFLPDAAAPSAGAWYYLDAQAGSHVRLANVDFRWGGRNGHATLRVQSSDVIASGCTIRDSSGEGIWVANEAYPRITGNQVFGNGFGARNVNAKSWVDARFVWWGDSSGPYHAALNPGGTGNAVSDKVQFEPWTVDEEGTLSSAYVVQVRGPNRVTPGATVDYSVYYATYVDLDDAVLAVTLPFTAHYLPRSADGIYQPSLRQVFWRLGNLAAGTEGELPLRVRYGWGIRDGLEDELEGYLLGANQGDADESVDLTPYTEFTPVTPTGRRTLTAGEVDAAIAASPQLKTFVDAAVASNYMLLGGADIALSNGDAFAELVLIDKGRHGAMWLRRRHANGVVIKSSVTPTEYTLADATGGLVATVPDGPVAFWGSWAGPTSTGAVQAMATATFAGCMHNCIAKSFGLYVVGKVSKRVDQAMQIRDCYLAVTSQGGDKDAIANCVVNLGSIAVEELAMVKDEVQLLYPCVIDCSADPTTHVCRQSIIVPNPSPQQRSFLAPLFEDPARTYTFYRCDPATRILEDPVTRACPPGYAPVGNGYWNRKINPPGPCVEIGLDQAVTDLYKDIDQRQRVGLRIMGYGRCRNTVRVARDPNAKYGPAGDVLAGERLSYTVTCENEGAGEAYGVFIMDQLHENLDESTLDLGGSGTWIPAARSILWDIGELAPKGQAGSTGSVSFSVAARADLAPGTVIPNRAVVYFPSVPEETPSNFVINTVAALTARPQTVETSHATPLGITLQGAPGSAAPFVYTITRRPSFGRLTGTPPDVTYTPDTGFVGDDHFSFSVASGAQASASAEVAITVTPPANDTTRPRVTWVWPDAGAAIANIGIKPVGLDDDGPMFSPFLQVELSEMLAAATVTAASVRVVDSKGHQVPVGVTFDSATRRLAIAVRQRWRATTYTVTVTTAVADLAGNHMAAPYTWSFTANPPGWIRERLYSLP